MPKRKGSGRPAKRAATKLAARKRPSPQPLPDDDVFIPESNHITTSADSVSDEDVFVPERPVYRPLNTSGIGQDWYPLQEGGASWQCPYGCPGVRAVAADLEMHTWDCPYWEHEGKDQTPFD